MTGVAVHAFLASLDSPLSSESIGLWKKDVKTGSRSISSQDDEGNDRRAWGTLLHENLHGTCMQYIRFGQHQKSIVVGADTVVTLDSMVDSLDSWSQE